MNALFKLTLKSSAIGALAFFAVTSGCSSSTDDNTGAGGDSSTTGGTNSTAGKSSTTAGKSGTGGDDTATTGGTASGTAGAAEGGANNGGAPGLVGEAGGGPDFPLGMGGDSAGGAGTGPAVAKFCNTLTFGENHDPTTMILQVGEGASKVTFTALSGTCVPADGAACKEIPQGAAVNVQLFDADDPTLALDAAPVTVSPGQDWIFYTDIQGGFPIWDGGTIKAGAGISCEDITYDDI